MSKIRTNKLASQATGLQPRRKPKAQYRPDLSVTSSKHFRLLPLPSQTLFNLVKYRYAFKTEPRPDSYHGCTN